MGKLRNREHFQLLAAFEDMLGTVPDSEIASVAGVPEVTVARYRTWLADRETRDELGAVARDSYGRNDDGAALPAGTVMLDQQACRKWHATRRRPLFAYRMHLSDRQLLVLAHDMIEATAIVRRVNEGFIERIDNLGLAL